MLLFWGLGGSWLQGGFYQPDNLARLAVVTADARESTGTLGGPGAAPGATQATRGKTQRARAGHGNESRSSARPWRRRAYLTFTAFPGAALFLDGAGAPFAVSPFVHREVERWASLAARGAGRRGRRSRDSRGVDRGGRRESLIAVVGPTLVFRQLHDQLVMQDSRGADGAPRGAHVARRSWGGIEPRHAGVHLLLRRRHRQERADPALRVAPRRHGRPHAGSRAHPRRHDGHRRRVHDRAARLALLAQPHRVRRSSPCTGASTALLRRVDRLLPVRHQEGARLQHREPARLHVHRRRRRRLLGRRLPPDDPRLLQGLPLPRVRLGHPRHARASSTTRTRRRTCATWAGSRG